MMNENEALRELYLDWLSECNKDVLFWKKKGLHLCTKQPL